MAPAPSSRRAAAVLAVVLGAGLLPAVAVPSAPAAPRHAQALPAGAVSPAEAAGRIAASLRGRLAGGPLGRDTSVLVWDAETGRALASRKAGAGRLPASNMKLVTAAGALSVLGADATLPTRVTRARGKGAKAVVLVGGGDPLLRRADLRLLARRTVAALAREDASGRAPARVRLFVDDSLFPAPTPAKGWRSDYVGRYVMPVRALGVLGLRSRDTSLATARLLATRLERLGVDVTVRGRTAADEGAELARVERNTVGQAVDAMLTHSNNQVAEVLHRQVALAQGRPATWAGARRAATAALRDLGVPTAGVRVRDGSGLSRANRLTSRALVALLRAAAERPELASLEGGLPVSGRTGTLRNRYRSRPTACARGRVLAKTGYLDGVVALSGYAHGVDGRVRVFSVLVNRAPRRHPVSAVQRRVDRVAAIVTGCL